MAEVFDPKNIVWESEDLDDKKKSTKRFNDESDSEFSKMFNDFSTTKSKGNSGEKTQLKIGLRITGKVLMISSDSEDVIVSLGNKSVGILPYSQIASSKEYSNIKVGDMISSVIVGKSGFEYTLSLSSSASLKSQEDIKTAYENRLAVRGKVVSENKGGFDVLIFGKKAFCPISAMDLGSIVDKSIYLDKDFEFIITQFEEGNLVVSRTELLKIRQKESLTELQNQLESDPFLELEGTVSRIQNFGAFVKLDNGIEGLIHKSELSWGKVTDVSDVVSVGDRLRVKVLKISNENGKTKVSLSVKSVSQDPWETIDDKIDTKNPISGTVTKIERFGAFIELYEGITGLLPDRSVVLKGLKVGDKVNVYVKEIDKLKRRISLSLSQDGESDSKDADIPSEWISKKENKGLGIFGKLLQDELERHRK